MFNVLALQHFIQESDSYANYEIENLLSFATDEKGLSSCWNTAAGSKPEVYCLDKPEINEPLPYLT